MPRDACTAALRAGPDMEMLAVFVAAVLATIFWLALLRGVLRVAGAAERIAAAIEQPKPKPTWTCEKCKTPGNPATDWLCRSCHAPR